MSHLPDIAEIDLVGPVPVPKNFTNLRIRDRLPENTHCEKERRDGG